MRVDLRKQPYPVGPLSFPVRHDGRIGIKGGTEYTGVLQQAPHKPSPTLVAHEPLQIRYLDPLGEAGTLLLFFTRARLCRQV